MLSRFPILTSFEGYDPKWASRDITAGLAVAAVAIPSAIAYPAIAGLPPEIGLYSSIFPLIGYALFGPSRQLMVGPDAATMTVLAAALAAIPAGSPAERVAAASVLALAVGIFCLVASLFRLGVIAAFLSKPILIGFISGISISILVGQIGRLTGVRIESEGLISPLLELWRKSDAIHWPSVLLGGTMFLLLQLVKYWQLRVPGPLIVVVVSIAASGLFDFQAMGIKVVGDLPAALPTLSLPSVGGLPIRELVLGALAVWLVSFGSGLVAARSFAARGKFEVDANAELLGLGAANLASGLFTGFPVTVSDSRTAINMSAGGRSQLAGLCAALTLLVLLVFLGNALRLLPSPALGAILVAAALSLIDLDGLKEIWRISRMEFVFALIGLWGAVSLGVLSGVAIAVAATLLYVLLKVTRPRDAMLGRVEGQGGFYKLHRKAAARPIPGLAICLIEGSLLFFNVDYVKTRLLTIASDLPEGTRWFVLDASAIVQIDSTAAAMLEEVRCELAERGILLAIAEMHNEPKMLLERSGLIDAIGKGMMFDELEEVPAAFERERVPIA
jgi:sulfate permease, SulP family